MGMVKEGNICNYCKLRGMRQVAEARQKVIKVRPSRGQLGGVNVYEVPDTGKHYDLKEGTGDHDRYYVGWFQSVTDHCVC
jgi:hypothetical protein